MKNEQRLSYMDIFKGILIILTAIGHNPFTPGSWIVFIYSFHMPAFFASYGLVYDMDGHCSKLNHTGYFRTFVDRRAKRLILPYFVWALIYNSPSLENLLLILYGSSEALTKAGGLSSLWYLPCMFIAVMMFETYILFVGRKYDNKNKQIIGMLIFILVTISIGFILPSFHIGEELIGFYAGYPWCIKSAFMSCGFIGIGYLIRTAVLEFKQHNRRYLTYLAVMFFSFGILVFTSKVNSGFVTSSTHHVALSKASYGNPVLFILDAICGILCVLVLSLLIDEYCVNRVDWIKQMLCDIGIDTMGIFLIHKYIVLYLSDIVSGHGVKGRIWIFIIVAAAILFSRLLTALIRKTLPEILGETRQVEKR